MSTFYPAHDGFIAPARVRPQLWRLILGVIVAFIIWVVVSLLIFTAAVLLAAPDGFFAEIAAWAETGGPGPFPVEREFAALMGGQRPTSVLVMLATFGGLVLGAMAAARWFQGRSVFSLIGPVPQMARHFAFAVAIAGAVMAASFLIPITLTLEPNLEFSVWLTFLPMAILLIGLQTGAEEIFFRGYLQQQLAARFRSPLVWMVLPSVLFGLGHIDPEQFRFSASETGFPIDVQATPFGLLVLGYTTLFGLLAADLTARTGTIGAAWGFHFTNNFVAILIISLEGPLSGLSLWYIPEVSVVPEELHKAILRDFAFTLAIWFLIRRFVRP